MNDMTIHGGNAVTMTSLELVEFINAHRKSLSAVEAELRHDHFMAKVPKVLGDAAPKFSGTVKRPQPTGGFRDYPCYILPKREACLMAMSYSYDLQAKVFDRMTALEARVPAIDPMQILSDPAAMRGLLLTYTEKVLTLEHKVEELAPKAEALDRIATADGSICISTAAKLLQIRPKDAFSWLSGHRWIFKRHGGSPWLGYQDKIQQGLLEMKVETVERSDGTKKTVENVLMTPKGLAKLALIFNVKPLGGNDLFGSAA